MQGVRRIEAEDIRMPEQRALRHVLLYDRLVRRAVGAMAAVGMAVVAVADEAGDSLDLV